MSFSPYSRSGQSIFSAPKPIDLNAARRAGYSLDIDMEDEEADLESGQSLLGRDTVLFDASREQRPQAQNEHNVWAD